MVVATFRRDDRSSSVSCGSACVGRLLVFRDNTFLARSVGHVPTSIFHQHATSKKNAPGTSVARATRWKAKSVRPRLRTSTRSYQLCEYYDWVLKTLADEFLGHYTWTRSGDVKGIGRLETLLDEVDLASRHIVGGAQHYPPAGDELYT